jgi:hypothetical protein
MYTEMGQLMLWLTCMIHLCQLEKHGDILVLLKSTPPRYYRNNFLDHWGFQRPKTSLEE